MKKIGILLTSFLLLLPSMAVAEADSDVNDLKALNGNLIDDRTVVPGLRSDLDGCQDFFGAKKGEATSAQIFDCAYAEVTSYMTSKDTVAVKEDVQFQSRSRMDVISSMTYLATVLTEESRIDKYLVFPLLMVMLLGGFVISLVTRLFNDRSAKLTHQETTKIVFATTVATGVFWKLVLFVITMSFVLLIFFTSRYNETVMQFEGDSVASNDTLNEEVKSKVLEFAGFFAIASLEARIIENQQVMMGVDHELPLEQQLNSSEFYNCLTNYSGVISGQGMSTNRYEAIKFCNKERGSYVSPPSIKVPSVHSGLQSAYEALNARSDIFVSDYLKYYCSVSSDGYENGGANNPVLCSDFRTGEFYKKIDLKDRSESAAAAEAKIAFDEKLRNYYYEMSDIYFDYIALPLTEEEEPLLAETIKMEQSGQSEEEELIDARNKPFVKFGKLVFVENQICNGADGLADATVAVWTGASSCEDNNNVEYRSKNLRMLAFELDESKVVGLNEAIANAYETDTEKAVRAELRDLVKVVYDDSVGRGEILNNREFFTTDHIDGVKFNYSKTLIVKELFITCEDNTNLRNCEMVMSTIPNIYLYYKAAIVTGVAVYGAIDTYIRVYDNYLDRQISKQKLRGAGVSSKTLKSIRDAVKQKKAFEFKKKKLEKNKESVLQFILAQMMGLLGFFALIIYIIWKILSSAIEGALITHILAPFLLLNGNLGQVFGFLARIMLSIVATVIAIILSTLVFNFALSIFLEVLMTVVGTHPSLYIMFKSNIIFMMTTMLYSAFLFLIMETILSILSSDLEVRLDNNINDARETHKTMHTATSSAMPSIRAFISR